MLWTPVWVGSRAEHSSLGLPRASTGGHCERRDRTRCYALGAVHSVGFWGPEKPQGQGRKEQGRRDSSKCLVRGGSKPHESRSDKRRAPWFLEPQLVVRCPAQSLPPTAAVAGKCAGRWWWSILTCCGWGWPEPLPNTARPASRGRKDPSRGPLWNVVINLRTCRKEAGRVNQADAAWTSRSLTPGAQGLS